MHSTHTYFINRLSKNVIKNGRPGCWVINISLLSDGMSD